MTNASKAGVATSAGVSKDAPKSSAAARVPAVTATTAEADAQVTPADPIAGTGSTQVPENVHELRPTKATATSTTKARWVTYEGEKTKITHPASLAIDRTAAEDMPNPTTAWQARGSGIGESITVTFSRPSIVRRVRIVPGYHKMGNAGVWYRYDTTPSVRNLTVSLEDGTPYQKELADLRNADPKNNHILDINLPAEMLKPTSSLKFTINDIYPPSSSPPSGKTDEKASEDTAISALVFWGTD